MLKKLKDHISIFSNIVWNSVMESDIIQYLILRKKQILATVITPNRVYLSVWFYTSTHLFSYTLFSLFNFSITFTLTSFTFLRLSISYSKSFLFIHHSVCVCVRACMLAWMGGASGFSQPVRSGRHQETNLWAIS